MTRPAESRCERCRKSGFYVEMNPLGRPQFVCEGCDATWTSGKNGHPYLKWATNADAWRNTTVCGVPWDFS